MIMWNDENITDNIHNEIGLRYEIIKNEHS